MKSTALLFFLFLSISVCGQTGDFQLKSSQQRSYKRISGNPSLQGNKLSHFFIGTNYRKEWTDSIRVPVLDFKTDFGGLTPEKEGGGKQTRTLHVKDREGRKWVLRSIQKFPEKVIAPEMKGTIAEDVVSDGISASYPYSVLSVGTLAKSAGVPYLPNTVVYIPDGPELGEFRSKYKNTLALLELRTIENNKELKTYDTEEIIPEIQNTSKKTVDQKAVLRARLLDNFIMDFDRYEGQWLWVEKKSDDRTVYYPIPKDRDQTFFNADGILPVFMSGKPALGPLQGLRAKPKNINNFNYSERNFDRTFLTEPDEQTWSSEIDQFLSAMSDQVIDHALNKQPEEIKNYHAETIAGILKNKRSSFKADMMSYYRFLSATVSVVGSNDAEKFLITKNPGGTVAVQMQSVKSGAVLYKRVFDPSVTREIRLYGLEGDDQFLVAGSGSPIKIRIIGGPGEDVFQNNAQDKNVLVYDVSFEKNTFDGKGFKKRISGDPLNNEYSRLDNDYNTRSIGIHLEYSTDRGLLLGPGIKVTTTGFRKEPYASRHFFYVTRALSSPAWHLHYDADFIRVTNNTDLLFRSDAKLPTVRTHFFGYGNNTGFDKSRGLDYYKARYTIIDASLMARHALASWLQLQYGPLLEYLAITSEKNNAHYIRTYPPQNTGSIYGSKWFPGGEIKMIVNTRNNELIPTRGVYANIYSRELIEVSGEDRKLNQTGAEVSLYNDFLLKNHIILATSFGVSRNSGDFEIPQAQYLGFKQNLRGYRYQRFAGSSRAYNNSEVRINFGDVNLYLVKGPFGVLCFHDIGRVWMNGEHSDTWHRGYGGGVWMAPFNKILVAATLTSSEEDTFPMVTFGFQF